MNEFELNLRLKQEMEALAPNRLEELLAACDQAAPEKVNTVPAPPAARGARWARLTAVAAAAAILIGGVFYGTKDLQRSVITVDAGTEFAMTVNGFDRVKYVSVLPSAKDLLDTEAMTGRSLDDAVSIAAQNLLDSNRLSSAANGVLVSVRDATDRRADALCEHVTARLEEAAASADFAPAVLTQQISGQQSGLDALRAVVVEQSAGITAEMAERMNLQELLYAVNSQGISWESASLTGALTNWMCATAQDAETRVMDYVGLDTSDKIVSSVLSVFSDELAYRVTGSDWEYWVSAATGNILNIGRAWIGANDSSVGYSGGGYRSGSGDPAQDTVDFVQDVIHDSHKIKGFVDFIDRLF